MKISDVINKQWVDPSSLTEIYQSASPFPHIVITDFIVNNILEAVLDEFPDLLKLKEKDEDKVIKYETNKETKLVSEGTQALSPSALYLNSYLQSDSMMNWLNKLTGIKEPLISDPYLSGGGYHETKTGGFLKVHADFNKHSKLNLDRRLNLLIYLNKNWKDEYGGGFAAF